MPEKEQVVTEIEVGPRLRHAAGETVDDAARRGRLRGQDVRGVGVGVPHVRDDRKVGGARQRD